MRKFGIEIELIGLSTDQATAAIVSAGVPCRNAGYTHAVSHSWKVVTDGSVGSRGCEVVSPVLEGEEGMTQVKTVLEALDGAGAGVNRACGLHVHVDAGGMTGPQIATVVARYGMYEAEIDRVMPPSRRGSANNYCQSVATQRPRGNTARDVAGSVSGRYYKVNLQSFIKYGTIEFRQHSGTLNWSKVRNWVTFLQHFVDECCRLAPRRAGTVRPASRLNRTEQRIVRLLSDGNARSREHISAELDGVLSPASVGGALASIRRAGYAVERYGRPGTYRYTIAGHPPAVETFVETDQVDNGLWSGIPDEVREFYQLRAASLAAGA